VLMLAANRGMAGPPCHRLFYIRRGGTQVEIA
jgi:hypothetical protein